LLLLALIIWVFFWWSRPAPTCFDEIKNGTELGVDCGGACTRVCSVEVDNLISIWTRVFEITPNNYTVVGLFDNPNLRFASPESEYIIDYRNSNGRTVATSSGLTFINPGRLITVFKANLISDQKITQAFVSFPDIHWERIAKQAPNLVIRRQKVELDKEPRLTVLVTNNEALPVSDIKIVAVISDQNNNAFTASATSIERLVGGETKTVYFTWPSELTKQPVFFDFYAEANAFLTPDI